MLALFQESRLVDNERSAFALAQQSLETIRGGIAGQLPGVFAFQLSQQAAEVVLGPLTQVAASKVRAELRQ